MKCPSFFVSFKKCINIADILSGVEVALVLLLGQAFFGLDDLLPRLSVPSAMSMLHATKFNSSGPRTPLSMVEGVYVIFLRSSDGDNDLMAFILLTIDIRTASKK